MSKKQSKAKPIITRIVASPSSNPKKPGFIVNVEFDDKTTRQSPVYSTPEETESAGKTFQETGKFPKPVKVPPVKLVDRAGITGAQPPNPMGARFPFGKDETEEEDLRLGDSGSSESNIGETYSGKQPVMVFKNPANEDYAFIYDGGTTKRYPKGYFLRSHKEILSAKPDIEKDGGSAFECPYWHLEKIRAYMDEQGYKLIKG